MRKLTMSGILVLATVLSAGTTLAKTTATYEGSIDIAMGQRITFTSGPRHSPYIGRYYFRFEHVTQDEMPLASVRAGVGYDGVDPDERESGTAYCWTQMIYSLGVARVTVNNEDNGIFLGDRSSPIQASVLFTRPFDGECKAQPVMDAAKVEVEAKDFYAADMKFDVQMGVRLETRLLTVSGDAKIVGGKLVDFRLAGGKDSQVHWFAYDPSLVDTARSLMGTVSGSTIISPTPAR